LDLDHGAVRIEFLHRHDGAREHIAVAAVFGGDALGKVVDRLQRDRLADEVGVEFGQLGGGVDRGADDANLGMTSLVSAAPGGASMPGTEIAGPPGCASGTGGRSNRSRSRPG